MQCAALGNNVDLFEASTSLRVFQLFIANLTLALLWFGIKIFRSLYLEPNVLCNLRSLLHRWLQTLMHFLRKDFLQNAQEQKQNGKLWRTSRRVFSRMSNDSELPSIVESSCQFKTTTLRLLYCKKNKLGFYLKFDKQFLLRLTWKNIAKLLFEAAYLCDVKVNPNPWGLTLSNFF